MRVRLQAQGAAVMAQGQIAGLLLMDRASRGSTVGWLGKHGWTFRLRWNVGKWSDMVLNANCYSPGFLVLPGPCFCSLLPCTLILSRLVSKKSLGPHLRFAVVVWAYFKYAATLCANFEIKHMVFHSPAFWLWPLSGPQLIAVNTCFKNYFFGAQLLANNATVCFRWRLCPLCLWLEIHYFWEKPNRFFSHPGLKASLSSSAPSEMQLKE